MNHQLKQLIPSEVCLSCQICCRFPERQGSMVPLFSSQERDRAIELGLSRHDFPPSEEKRGVRIRTKPLGECFRCPAFEPSTHECQIYPERPFDCQLYPFMLMFNSEKTRICLVMDSLCPFIQSHKEDPSVRDYSRYLVNYLSRTDILKWICHNQNLIAAYTDSFIPICHLEKLTEVLIPPPIQGGLSPFRREDFNRFKKAFGKRKAILSCEHFLSHYLWSDVLRYSWTEIHGSFCLFAEQDHHLFMPIPPIADELDPFVIEDCFNLMNFWNENRSISRIAGFKEEDLLLLPHPEKYKISLIEKDYLYLRSDLVELKGNVYKSKRGSYNQFTRNYPNAVYRPFINSDVTSCLRLYQDWLEQYQKRTLPSDQIEMARENYSVHQKAMLEYAELGLIGRVIEWNGKIIAYTFGAELNLQTFYILFEITDLKFQGISQFLFREFCREMQRCPFIHAGGDSGFSSLARVKESYHPIRRYSTYQITKKPGEIV